jgi:hypothetical protein
MAQDLYVGAYWGPWRESVDECGDRLMVCLNRLAQSSEVFANWYETGRSRKDALKRPISLQDKAHMLRLLDRGVHRRDTDKSVIEDLGFGIGIWNGAADERAASLSVHCGCYSTTPRMGNTCVLNLPKVLGDLEKKERLVEVLRALVIAWEPDWGGVISRRSREARNLPVGSVYVDWILYLNRTNVDRSRLPASASVESINSLGTIITTQDCPIDPTNAADLNNVNAVAAALDL